MKQIDPVIIIEVNGHRVLSVVDWPERSNVLTVTSQLVDAAGEPLVQEEGAPPVAQQNKITFHNNPDYGQEQALHDVEMARFKFAGEIAGHGQVHALRLAIGPHQVAPPEKPPVVSAPRVPRPQPSAAPGQKTTG